MIHGRPSMMLGAGPAPDSVFDTISLRDDRFVATRPQPPAGYDLVGPLPHLRSDLHPPLERAHEDGARGAAVELERITAGGRVFGRHFHDRVDLVVADLEARER